MGAHHPAVSDLHHVVDVALARAGRLLTRGEHLVAQRIRALEGTAALLYARLTLRVPEVHEVATLTTPGVPDVAGALDELTRIGLVDGLVTWPQRAAHLPRADLVAALRILGLPRSGGKAELVERLAPYREWHAGRWIRVRHRRLVRRLEQWAQLRAHPDRTMWVVARLGVVRWPRYPLTRGTPLWPHRRALLAWENLVRAELTAEEAVAALRDGTARAPGRLDGHRHVARAVVHLAREQERSDAHEQAVTLYRRLHEEAGIPLPSVAFRWSRALEAVGAPDQALAVLRRARPMAQGAQALEIARAGRRLARRLRTGWAPDRPLRAPPERHLRMTQHCLSGPSRPQWDGGAGPQSIEAATQSLLASHGRRSVHAEGRLWRTLFALLFADTYFLPVPGALPVSHLPGPLDLGTPAFRTRRAEAVTGVLEAVSSGEAPDRITDAHSRWEGVHLSWARWDVADADTLAHVAAGIGPVALRTILEAFLDHGRRASRGLPDLVILPGPEAALDQAVPRRIPPDLLLAEVKGPGDTVRDDQAIWMDRLVAAAVSIEIWNIRAAPEGCLVDQTRHCAV